MVKNLLILFLVALFIASCGSSKKAARNRTVVRSNQPVVTTDNKGTPAETNTDTKKEVARAPIDNVEAYINAYAEIAKEEMRNYKIPASVTMAQAILESGAGRGELTRKANNHFGIKCHDWKGARVYHDDDEKGECFRKYNDPKYSFRDHSLFLTGRRRYASLFDLDADDYKGWAHGLRKAGYATDRRYPDKLIALIKRYELNKFDDEVLGNKYNKGDQDTIKPYEQIDVYKVKKGETLYAIARKHNMTVETLKNYNGLTEDAIYVGQVLYVKPIN